jgi:hypothetical protein
MAQWQRNPEALECLLPKDELQRLLAGREELGNERLAEKS